MQITIYIDESASKFLVQNIARGLGMQQVEDEEARVALGSHLGGIISELAIRGEELRLDEENKAAVKAALLKISVQ